MPEIDKAEQTKIIKGILVTHAQDGATIQTIRRDYEEWAGQALGNNLDEATKIIQEIPGTYTQDYLWYVRSDNSKHIAKLVAEQRPSKRSEFTRRMYLVRQQRQQELFIQNRKRANLQKEHENEKTSKCNKSRSRERSPRRNVSPIRYRSRSPVRKRSPSPRQEKRKLRDRAFSFHVDVSPRRRRDISSRSNRTRSRERFSPRRARRSQSPRLRRRNSTATLSPRASESIRNSAESLGTKNKTNENSSRDCHDFIVVGDNILVYFALNKRARFPMSQISASNHCFFGQTIQQAIESVETSPANFDSRVIINIGMTDICQGIGFHDICMRYIQLVHLCKARGMKPTITTLMPIGSPSMDVLWKVLNFNKFLLENYTNVIDLWSCLSYGLGEKLSGFLKCDNQPNNPNNNASLSWNHLDQRLSLFRTTSDNN